MSPKTTTVIPNTTAVVAVSAVALVFGAACRLGANPPATQSGIFGLPAKTDADTPGIEYREVVINGKVYTATPGAYWPGGAQERWNLVGPK